MNSSRWATAPTPEPKPAPTKQDDSQPAAAAKGAPQPPQTQTYEQEQEQDFISSFDAEDEFAQTRPPDDLFDDDFTPLEQPAPVEPAEPIPDVPQREPIEERASISIRGQGAPRGPRGPRRGSQRGQAPPRERQEAPPAQSANTEATAGASPAPTGEQEARPERREAAVRGDRSGTGGLKREKLTEEELSAKLAAMKVKNASLMEQHAKSQADEDAFAAREAKAAVKRREERQNRQQLMGEREKNRQRKLQAQGGREWDQEKDEQDFNSNDRRGARRGAHGGIATSVHASTPDAPPEFIERRGGFRGRGGRRGRGDAGSPRPRQEQQRSQADAKPPTAVDFPDLPAASKTSNDEKADAPKTLEFPSKKPAPALEAPPVEEKKSWADQMEG